MQKIRNKKVRWSYPCLPIFPNLFQTDLLRLLSLAITLCILSLGAAHAQSNKVFSHNAMAEKVYLQLDGTVYTTDNTIWFKAILTHAIDHTPSKLSKILYVELIDANQSIVERKLIKINNGIGNGDFQLKKEYLPGLYQIKAYTQWNKNFDTDFAFKEYIRLFAASTNPKLNPIRNVTLDLNRTSGRMLSATIDPTAIDTLHKNELNVFLSYEGKNDTLMLRKDKDKFYKLNYLIPDNYKYVTLQIQTKNQNNYYRTIALNESYLDLQFFPESGELVHGIPGKVGFKAIGIDGKARAVQGQIIDQSNRAITDFKSNELGMGSFTLTTVDSSLTYTAVVKSDKGIVVKYPLPAVAHRGNVLSVTKDGKNIILEASSNYQTADSITISIHCRGLNYIDIKGCLKDGKAFFLLPSERLPEGILAFVLTDNTQRRVAERLYFNEKPEDHIKIDLSTDKDSYTKREQTVVNLQTTNQKGEPVNAHVSLMVLNDDLLGKIQSTRQNILSYFLMSSDLKGDIENPGSYFNGEKDHFEDLDALLLTQGWRKYNYTRPVGEIIFQPELNLSVSGTVGDMVFHKKMMKDVDLRLMGMSENKALYDQKTDSLGRFNFKLDDEFGRDMKFVIMSSNKKGVKKKEYEISLDKKDTLDIDFDQIKTMEKPDSVVNKIVRKKLEFSQKDNTISSGKGIILKEVVVEGEFTSPQKNEMTEEYGKPQIILTGEEVRKQERKWSPDLLDALRFGFRNQLEFDTDNDGYWWVRVQEAELTIVFVDGIIVSPEEIPSLNQLPASEILSIEIIKNPVKFSWAVSQLWSIHHLMIKRGDGSHTVYNPYTGPVRVGIYHTGAIISIYTRSRKGLYATRKSQGILRSAIPAFSKPSEFYTPKYPTVHLDDFTVQDLRSLAHWNPTILVDSLGKASTTFYNADIPGKMQVVVEAITEKGEIGYKEISYDVKDLKNITDNKDAENKK